MINERFIISVEGKRFKIVPTRCDFPLALGPLTIVLIVSFEKNRDVKDKNNSF